ncbi:MAG: glycoside hydrolase family 38 C-terminal domain-containing protein [Rhodoluna sp.]
MATKIEKVYLANHSHTDLGFTDHQDVVFRQHIEFIDRAIELCEYSANAPAESQYRWVCEVTGITERWFAQASREDIARFMKCHERGQIEVTGMQWNFTPMLGPEQMARSLYPINNLRKKYGVTITSAMQSDSNGISWMYVDFLKENGIDFLTMSVNAIRGGVPKPTPQAFIWEGPSGNKLLTWNGFHYLYGRSNIKVGDWRYVDRFLPKFLGVLEESDAYPWNFLYCQSTHPIRVDNGPPDIRMIDFVREWNEQGRTPQLAFSTPGKFRAEVLAEHESKLPVYRGEWLDWWADGVASSAYETGLNRATHSIMRAAETISTWGTDEGRPVNDLDRVSNVFEMMSLYDEHTWGAFASISAPDSLWTKGQWNYKASFAYRSSGEAHDILARSARRFAAELADLGPEGRFNLGDLTSEEAFPPSNTNELLVYNTLPWPRTVYVKEPEIRAGGAPVGMLESFVPRGIPWGGDKPSVQERRIKVDLPAFGYAWVDMGTKADESDLSCSANVIENQYYRVEIDSSTGAVKSLFDKELQKEFASKYRGWQIGQLVHQEVDPGTDGYSDVTLTPGRDALNTKWDFSQVPDFGAWNTNIKFINRTHEGVKVGAPVIDKGRVAISVNCTVKGVKRATALYWLDSRIKSFGIEWEIDKEHVRDAEEIFVAFPAALEKAEFRADVNAVPFTPDLDQLPGTVRDWFPLRDWVNVSDGKYGMTVAPIDAPLMQLGGITTAKAAAKLSPEGPVLMSWALNNHWMVNFKASQGGIIPLRYQITTHAGSADDVAAAKFASEVHHPAIIMRDYERRGSELSKSFLSLTSDSSLNVSAKEALDGRGVILRVHSAVRSTQQVKLNIANFGYSKAHLVSALEEDLGKALAINGGEIAFELKPSEYLSIRLTR